MCLNFRNIYLYFPELRCVWSHNRTCFLRDFLENPGNSQFTLLSSSHLRGIYQVKVSFVFLSKKFTSTFVLGEYKNFFLHFNVWIWKQKKINALHHCKQLIYSFNIFHNKQEWQHSYKRSSTNQMIRRILII